MVLYKVVINSITVKDDNGAPDPNELVNFESEDDAEDAIGEGSILAKQTINDIVTLVEGQTVEIFRGFITSTDERVFKGFISHIKPSSGITEIVIKNQLWNLVRKRANKIYDSSIDPSAGEISEIAEDLFVTFGGFSSATVVPTGVADGQKIDVFKCINARIWERLQALRRAVNYQIRYDADADVPHFEPRGFNETGKTLTVGIEIMNVPDWDYNTDRMVNSLQVDGAVTLTDLRFPTSGTGKIGTTTGFETTGITLPKTPEVVKLTIDASDPPTTLREGGSKDGTISGFFFTDKENKIVKPTDSTGTFTTDDFAFVDYEWAAPVPILMDNETSIDKHGIWEDQQTFTDISSIADAESRAVEILARFSTPIISTTILVQNTAALDLRLGDLIKVIDTVSKPNVDRTFVITKRTIKYPGDVEEFEIGDAPLRIADWESQTEDRIKRLEEELLRNQDLVVRLPQFKNFDGTDNNTKKTYAQFRHLQTQDYTTADNTMIWDNATHGIWDTDNWATDANPDGFDDPVNHFFQSFNRGTQDKYVEDFVDDDFKAVTTTASWTTTGSVTFTSGQIAESTTFDFNNGTITVATLTSTEVSGALDYEMTANGSDYEAVTSGVAHIFSNSGTDLRWRATENAASTAEISNITVTSYH